MDKEHWSNSKSFKDSHIIPCNCMLEDECKREGEAYCGEYIEQNFYLLVFALTWIASKFFKVLNLESTTMILIYISFILVHEVTVSFIEYQLASVIREVVSLEVVKEYKIFDIINVGNLSTFVHRLRAVEYFFGSMGYNFSPLSISSNTR